MLPSNRIQIIEQTKFSYSALVKALEKVTEQRVGALKFLEFPNNKRWIKTNWGYNFTKSDEWIICIKLKEFVK